MTVFETRFEEAEGLRRARYYSAALTAYCDLLRYRITVARDSLGTVQTTEIVLMERISELAMFYQQPLSAAELLDASHEILCKAGNSYAAAWASVKAAYAYLVAGRWELARAALDHLTPQTGNLRQLSLVPESIQDWEITCRWPGVPQVEQQALIIRILMELGRQAASVGMYRGSCAALERASHLANGVDHPLMLSSRLPLKVELASSRLERGDLAGCETMLNELPPDATGDALESLSCTELQAKCAVLSGKFGEGLKLLQMLYGTHEQMGIGPAAAATALSLAHLYVLLNQTEHAAGIARALLQKAEQQRDSLLAERSRILLELTYRRGRSVAEGVAISPTVTEWWEGAAISSNTASVSSTIPVFESSNSRSFLDLFQLRCLTFFWLLAAQNFDGAATYAQELTKVFGQTDSMLILSRQLLLQGIALYYRGELAAAMSHLQQAFEVSHELGFVHDSWQAARVLKWIAVRTGDSYTAKISGQTADQLLGTMASTLHGADRPLFLLNKWSDEEERLADAADEIARRQREKAAFRWAPKQLMQMKRAYRLLQRIDAFREGTIEKSVASTRRSSQLRSSLLSFGWRFIHGTAFIRFLVLPDRVVILSISQGRIEVGISALTRIQVREQVGRIHRALRDAGPEAFAEQMQQLAIMLQWPLLLSKLATNVTRLFVLPDDSLHGVPFSALPLVNGITGDRYALTVGFDSRKQVPGKAAQKGVGIALPLGNDTFRELKNAQSEIIQFEGWCAARGLEFQKLGPQATKEKVLAAWAEAGYLHMSCHGKFQTDAPDHSGLVLIHDDRQSEMLSLRDVCGIDLSKTGLVTLGSCWGADNFVLPGRFVISLPEICWRSGAHNTLASLWEVVDEVGLAFMRRFYEYLAYHRPDKALQLTQKDARSSALPGCALKSTSDPYLWGGFQLYGSL